jgi:GntR family transcriptional regulator, carbon starvation induced regulator
MVSERWATDHGLAALSSTDGPPTRTDWAEQVIRNEILTGALRPGQRLKMAELQARYPGLSPTPLREALSRLSGTGLVEFMPNRGIRVAPSSLEELRDVYANRLLLETVAFERSFDQLDQSWQDEVRHALEDFEALSGDAERQESVTASSLMAWENAHRRFHFAILSRCSSPWLLRLLDILYDQSVRYRYLTIQAHPEFGKIAQRHRVLTKAVFARDPTRGLEALRRHADLTVASTEKLDETSVPPLGEKGRPARA